MYGGGEYSGAATAFSRERGETYETFTEDSELGDEASWGEEKNKEPAVQPEELELAAGVVASCAGKTGDDVETTWNEVFVLTRSHGESTN